MIGSFSLAHADHFAAPGAGAEPPFNPPGTLASFTTYRDASAMWQATQHIAFEKV